MPSDRLSFLDDEADDFDASWYQIPEDEMPAGRAYEIVHEEAMLDGNARLNLATFVSTWMDEHARLLYAESVDKNMIDKDEYPKTAEIEERCWRAIANLWHAPDAMKAIGASTIGSSEAAMLAGLALKRRWQERQRAAGKPTDRPNMVMSSAVQVCWEKFCNYWEIEPRYVPVTVEHPCLDGSSLADYVDENTIGVVAIMGVTYTGVYEPVQEICDALDALQRETGLDVPVHVDGASGGMVAPFLQPDIVWDFRLPRVSSINVSGHKFGMVYPGLGWVVWRDEKLLPESMIFRVSYLGGDMPTLALNFSRPGAQVLLQYYMFLRLGMKGYAAVHGATQQVAKYLADEIGSRGPFEVVADGSDIPVVAWRLTDDHAGPWDLYDLSDRLRNKGWQVPAYPLPESLQDTTVMRIVVRRGRKAIARDFMKDFDEALDYLENLSAPLPSEGKVQGFAH